MSSHSGQGNIFIRIRYCHLDYSEDAGNHTVHTVKQRTICMVAETRNSMALRSAIMKRYPSALRSICSTQRPCWYLPQMLFTNESHIICASCISDNFPWQSLPFMLHTYQTTNQQWYTGLCTVYQTIKAWMKDCFCSKMTTEYETCQHFWRKHYGNQKQDSEVILNLRWDAKGVQYLWK